MRNETPNERNATRLAVMSEKINNIEKDIADIKSTVREVFDRLDNHYVTKSEFMPVRTIVYGLITLIVLAVVGAIISLVVMR